MPRRHEYDIEEEDNEFWIYFRGKKSFGPFEDEEAAYDFLDNDGPKEASEDDAYERHRDEEMGL